MRLSIKIKLLVGLVFWLHKKRIDFLKIKNKHGKRFWKIKHVGKILFLVQDTNLDLLYFFKYP